MNILSLNINGLAAFYNRGDGEGSLLNKLITENSPDLIFFNETKCSNEDVQWWLGDFTDWEVYSNSSTKKGYAGVACMVRKGINPLVITPQLMDNEYCTGRIICVIIDDVAYIGVYTVNSGSEKEDLRIEWDKLFKEWIKEESMLRKIVVLGDLNSITDPEDCWNYYSYHNAMPGVCDFEIDALKGLKDECKLLDAFKYLNPEQIQYSWFSYRGNSRYVNHGFRLDYALVDERLTSSIEECRILGEPCEYSDHNPIFLKMKV